MASDSDRDRPAGLPGLPWDVFLHIGQHLSREDVLALSYTCETVRDPALQLLLAFHGLKVKNKHDFDTIVRLLDSKPDLRDAVGRLWVGRLAPWWSLDILAAFRSLHSFVFRPENLTSEPARRMIRTVAAGNWIPPSLHESTVEMFYSDFKDVDGAVLDELLITLMSVPSLKVLTATYARDLSEHDPSYQGYPPNRPRISRPFICIPRCSDLRELRLRWDDMSLHKLSKILESPRKLEELHLILGRSRPLNPKRGPSLPFNTALKPVSLSLRKLLIFPMDDGAEEDYHFHIAGLQDDLDFQWGDGGLREFEKLEFLAVPTSAWAVDTENCKRLLLPASLTRLRLFHARMQYAATIEQRRQPRSEWTDPRLLFLYPIPLLQDVQAIVDGTPRLRYIEISPKAVPDMDDVRERKPPVHLRTRFAPIVKRGIRILIPLPGGGSLDLETEVWYDRYSCLSWSEV